LVSGGAAGAKAAAKVVGVIAKLAEKQFGEDAAKVAAEDVTKDLPKTAAQDAARDAARDAGKIPGQVHPKVPPYEGGKTSGLLKIGDTEEPLVSGETGPGQWLMDNLTGGPGSGLTRAWTHVEGHAAGYMRMHGVNQAELFINQVPCAAGAAKCRYVLNKLLAPGAILDVHFPNASGGVSTWRFIGGVTGWSEL
jgi:hypothetical protein